MPSSSTLPSLGHATGALVFAALVGWFSLVLGAGVAGLLTDPPRPLIALGLFGAIVGLVLSYRRNAALRAWVDALDARVLVAWHVVRAPIGVWFLMSYARGDLPGELALLAGWGDIASGLGAALLLLPGAGRRSLVATWNVLAAIDIVMVVGTAQKILLFEGGFAIGNGFPFILLPWFVVPLVVVTHVVLGLRLRRRGRPPLRW